MMSPALPQVHRPKDHVPGHVEDIGIMRREEDRVDPIEAVLLILDAVRAVRILRPDVDDSATTQSSAVIVLFEYADSTRPTSDGSGDHNVGILGLGRDVPTLRHANEDNRVVKLRHAMPLYGRVNIQVTPNLVVQSAAVLPSREKKINLPPYPDINHEFRRTSKNDTELAVFLGTSMRDPDILDVYQQSVDRVPTFLVAPGDREAGRGSFIRQSASIFLVSTLPMALRGDTSELLNVASHQSSTENVLEPLVDALDSARDADVRRIAIERLAAQKVALGREEVETLLRANEPDVRKYALALVPGSRDREELLRIAAKVELEIDDQDFTVELGLLDRLLNAPQA